MKNFFFEDQYRVLGMMDGGASRVAWYGTPEEAVTAALGFDRGIVSRPDGTVVGEYFARRGSSLTATAPRDAAGPERDDNTSAT